MAFHQTMMRYEQQIETLLKSNIVCKVRPSKIADGIWWMIMDVMRRNNVEGIYDPAHHSSLTYKTVTVSDLDSILSRYSKAGEMNVDRDVFAADVKALESAKRELESPERFPTLEEYDKAIDAIDKASALRQKLEATKNAYIQGVAHSLKEILKDSEAIDAGTLSSYLDEGTVEENKRNDLICVAQDGSKFRFTIEYYREINRKELAKAVHEKGKTVQTDDEGLSGYASGDTMCDCKEALNCYDRSR